jgi:hypothetical protein
MNIRDALKTETATTLRCEAEAQAGIERDEILNQVISVQDLIEIDRTERQSMRYDEHCRERILEAMHNVVPVDSLGLIDADELEAMARKAETGEQWAEVCHMEAMMRTCDICERPTDNRSVMVYGIETTACDECRGN